MVVMLDADFDQAVDALIGSAYGSAGERCMATSIAVLVGDVADKIVPRLAERARTLKIVDGMLEDAEMGPIITRESVQRISGCIEEGRASGASLVVDGRFEEKSGQPFTVMGREQGFWLGTTLFDHVRPSMKIYREEIFGPVLACVRWSPSAMSSPRTHTVWPDQGKRSGKSGGWLR